MKWTSPEVSGGEGGNGGRGEQRVRFIRQIAERGRKRSGKEKGGGEEERNRWIKFLFTSFPPLSLSIYIGTALQEVYHSQ